MSVTDYLVYKPAPVGVGNVAPALQYQFNTSQKFLTQSSDQSTALPNSVRLKPTRVKVWAYPQNPARGTIAPYENYAYGITCETPVVTNTDNDLSCTFRGQEGTVVQATFSPDWVLVYNVDLNKMFDDAQIQPDAYDDEQKGRFMTLFRLACYNNATGELAPLDFTAQLKVQVFFDQPVSANAKLIRSASYAETIDGTFATQVQTTQGFPTIGRVIKGQGY